MDFWQDARYAVRRLMEARWFTLAAVAALSIGIGANAMGFTIVNAILIRGLPFENPDRIVGLRMLLEDGGQTGLSFPDIEDILEESRTLANVVGIVGSTVNVSEEGRDPERIQGSYVSAGFFELIDQEPIRGRRLLDADDEPGAPPVVVIGYDVWQERYSASEDVVGQTIRVNSLPATIVGVMPEGMHFLGNVDLWIPKDNLPAGSAVEDRGNRGRQVIARLADGATIEQATQELEIIAQRLSDEYPETNAADMRPVVQDFNTYYNGTEIRTIFGSLMGAVIFVLLIACANVANLMLAKSADRTREIAVRVSLGATRGRVVRQLLVESLLIAMLAGAVGLVIGTAGVRWFDGVTSSPSIGKPYWMEFTLDPIVFAYVALTCLGTAVLFGLAPALQVSKTDVNDVLKEGTRGGSGGMRARRWASVLVVGEMVLTLALLSGAALFVASFNNASAREDTLDSEGLLVMEIYLPLTKYPDPPEQIEVLTNLLDRLQTAQGIEASAIASSPPLMGGGRPGVEIDGRVADPEETRTPATVVTVSEDYFRTVRLDLTQGRNFNRADGEAGNETVIVNERFVEQHLQGGDALGRRVRFGANPNTAPDDGWMTIVGVVPNIPQGAVEDEEFDAVAYRPLRGNPGRTVVLLVRAPGDVSGVAGEVRRAMRAVEPDVPVADVMTIGDRLAEQFWPFRVFGIMFSVFAGSALLLSAVGLYSITAHSVIQRMREFGIRISLGAEPREISRLALRRVLVQLAVGVPLGLAGAYGVGRLLSGFMVQVEPGDPILLGGIAVLLAVIAIAACLVPARRAAAVDPVTALRVE
jgi:putative ABC transport system permease protein